MNTFVFIWLRHYTLRSDQNFAIGTLLLTFLNQKSFCPKIKQKYAKYFSRVSRVSSLC